MHNNALNIPVGIKYQENMKQITKTWDSNYSTGQHVYINRKQETKTVNFAACDLGLQPIELSDITPDAERAQKDVA